MIRFSSGVLVAAAMVLAGCSSGGDADPSATPSDTSSPSIVGGDPGTWTPVTIDSDKPESVVVGQALNVTNEGVTKVSTSDEAVLAVSQPRTESSGGATFVPGAKAVGVGTATLSVFRGDSKLYDTVVTVTK